MGVIFFKKSKTKELSEVRKINKPKHFTPLLNKYLLSPALARHCSGTRGTNSEPDNTT